MFPVQDTIPRRKTPFVTWALIVLNSIVFLYEISLSPQQLELFIRTFGVVPLRFTSGLWLEHPEILLTLITNMFLHGGWAHIIGNMWYLWIFGDNVEDRFGAGRYLLFYIATGIAASVLHIVFNPTSAIPAVGASGAISGVLGAYFVLFPHSRIIAVVPVFFWPFFFELPAYFYLGIWFIGQFFSGTFSLLLPDTGGGVAWWAHIGGFVAGVVIARMAKKRLLYRPLYADEFVPIRNLYRI